MICPHFMIKMLPCKKMSMNSRTEKDLTRWTGPEMSLAIWQYVSTIKPEFYSRFSKTAVKLIAPVCSLAISQLSSTRWRSSVFLRSPQMGRHRFHLPLSQWLSQRQPLPLQWPWINVIQAKSSAVTLLLRYACWDIEEQVDVPCYRHHPL